METVTILSSHWVIVELIQVKSAFTDKIIGEGVIIPDLHLQDRGHAIELEGVGP